MIQILSVSFSNFCRTKLLLFSVVYPSRKQNKKRKKALFERRREEKRKLRTEKIK